MGTTIELPGLAKQAKPAESPNQVEPELAKATTVEEPSTEEIIDRITKFVAPTPKVRLLGARRGAKSIRNNLNQLYNHHKEMLRLSATGLRPSEVAEITGFDRRTVSACIHSDLGEAQLHELHAERDANAVDIGKRITEALPLALEAVISVVKEDGAGSAADKIRAGFGLLDRAGFGPVTKSASITTHLTAADLAEIKERAKEIGIMVGSPEPVEVEAEIELAEEPERIE